MKRKIVALVAVIAIAGGGYYAYSQTSAASVEYKTPEEADAYVRFVMEAYDSVTKNYWDKVDDAKLAEFVQLSLQKAQGALTMPILPTKDRAGAAKMLSQAFSIATSTDAKKSLATNTLGVLLYNLPPVGRNGLLSQTEEKAFREDVANVDTAKDLYQDLGIEKGASVEEVKLAYEAKAKELAGDNSAEAKAKLAQAEYAKSVLANPNTKDLYDEAKIEPTAKTNVIGKTLYIKIDRISPTTLLEFGRTVLSATSTPGLDSMIVDLRGNLGGALDFAQHFLGLFIGQNQYAFDLYHQGEYNVQRTAQARFPELSRYKEIAVLTDGMTQSTAEVTSAAFKRFKLGTVVGETTRGWGTVENTFPLETAIDEKEKYLLLLVHSITLRDDGEPVEGRGVDPDVSIKDPNWKKELAKRFESPEFVATIQKALANPPK
jgi:hypothetical protein